MEDNIEIPCDSDVSDGWSIVDYQTEDLVSHLRASTDSGLCSETLVASQQAPTDDLNECFELTEIFDPLGVQALDGLYPTVSFTNSSFILRFSFGH